MITQPVADADSAPRAESSTEEQPQLTLDVVHRQLFKQGYTDSFAKSIKMLGPKLIGPELIPLDKTLPLDRMTPSDHFLVAVDQEEHLTDYFRRKFPDVEHRWNNFLMVAWGWPQMCLRFTS